MMNLTHRITCLAVKKVLFRDDNSSPFESQFPKCSKIFFGVIFPTVPERKQGMENRISLTFDLFCTELKCSTMVFDSVGNLLDPIEINWVRQILTIPFQYGVTCCFVGESETSSRCNGDSRCFYPLA